MKRHNLSMVKHISLPAFTFSIYRPWYAQANAPVPKDIVIIFDGTKGGYFDVVKKAVGILLDTTNPNDRVSDKGVTHCVMRRKL